MPEAIELDGFVQARTLNGLTTHYEERWVNGHRHIFDGQLTTIFDYCALADWREELDRLAAGEREEE